MVIDERVSFFGLFIIIILGKMSLLFYIYTFCYYLLLSCIIIFQHKQPSCATTAINYFVTATTFPLSTTLSFQQQRHHIIRRRAGGINGSINFHKKNHKQQQYQFHRCNNNKNRNQKLQLLLAFESSRNQFLSSIRRRTKQPKQNRNNNITPTILVTRRNSINNNNNNNNNDKNVAYYHSWISENKLKKWIRKNRITTSNKKYVRMLSSSHQSSNDNNEVSNDNKNNNENTIGITISLALTYFTVMGAKCALPVVFSLLSTNLIFPSGIESSQYYMSRLLFISTLSIATGKLLLGPIIDSIGGIISLQIALVLLCILLCIISSCSTFYIFAISWICIDFIFSSCWAACLNSIYQIFPSNNHNNDTNQNNQLWTKQINILAASARTGNTIAFVLFSIILQYFNTTLKEQSWRPVFAISAISQLIPLCMLTYFSKRIKQKKHSNSVEVSISEIDKGENVIIHNDQTSSVYSNNKKEESSSTRNIMYQKLCNALHVLRHEVIQFEFWLHLISRSMLMIYASFLLFVPTLFTSVYQTSTSFASQMGSLYALGCLIAITFISPIYSSLYIQNNIYYKLLSYNLLLFVGATGSSLIQLGHMMGLYTLSIYYSAISMLIWGISFTIPFYIPPSLYALQRGNASATIADVFDIGGFILLALFNGYVASISNKNNISSWILTFQITTVCSLISYIALSMTVLLEHKKKKNKNTTSLSTTN